MSVTVRYFAGARAAAGTEQEDLDLAAESTVTALVGVLAQRHGAGLARVLDAATFLVEEIAAAPDRVIPPGATVDVLPPFAGG